jgi:pimeloyl-ACP methyl ester carboxylesterase
MKNLFLVSLAVILLLYLLYAGYFYLYQRTFLFPRHLITPPGPVPALPGLEQIWLQTSTGKVEGWYLSPLMSEPNTPAPLMIVAHGNADLIDRWLTPVLPLRQMGVGVLLVEYPGYARSQGVPTYDSIRESFLLAYDTIIHHPQVDPSRILLLGHSIGGGAAGILAAERPSVGLILLSSFTSIAALATDRWLPCFAARDPFNNLTALQNYPHPTLIIHGKRDLTIAYHHGVDLYEAAQQGELIALDCGHAGCIEDWAQFWRERAPFLTETGFLPANPVNVDKMR